MNKSSVSKIFNGSISISSIVDFIESNIKDNYIEWILYQNNIFKFFSSLLNKFFSSTYTWITQQLNKSCDIIK